MTSDPETIELIAEVIDRWQRSDGFAHRFRHLVHDRTAWEEAGRRDLAYYIALELQNERNRTVLPFTTEEDR